MSGVSISPVVTAAHSAATLPAQAPVSGGGGIGSTLSNLFHGPIGRALVFGALGAAAGVVLPVIPGGPIGGAIAGVVLSMIIR